MKVRFFAGAVLALGMLVGSADATPPAQSGKTGSGRTGLKCVVHVPNAPPVDLHFIVDRRSNSLIATNSPSGEAHSVYPLQISPKFYSAVYTEKIPWNDGKPMQVTRTIQISRSDGAISLLSRYSAGKHRGPMPTQPPLQGRCKAEKPPNP